MTEMTTTSFGEWSKEDLAGGLQYHAAVVEKGLLTVDIPYQIIHHGEMGKGEYLEVKEMLQDVSQLLRYVVAYNELEFGYEGEPLEPGTCELTIALGTSSKQHKGRWMRLLTGYAMGPARKVVKLCGVGLARVLAQEKADAYEAEDTLDAAKKFEGPIWSVMNTADGKSFVETEYVDEDDEDE